MRVYRGVPQAAQITHGRRAASALLEQRVVRPQEYGVAVLHELDLLRAADRRQEAHRKINHTRVQGITYLAVRKRRACYSDLWRVSAWRAMSVGSRCASPMSLRYSR